MRRNIILHCKFVIYERMVCFMEMTNIKNYIFDIGGVLLEYRWADMLMDHGLSREDALAIGNTMFNDPLWSGMDLAAAGEEQSIIEAYREKYPAYGDTIAWFINHCEYMHVPRKDVWERVHTLKELGYPLYLLSNYPETMFHKHTDDAPFRQDMSGGVISYEIKKLKPYPEIYQHLLQKYNLIPEECLFFDDRAENTEGARKQGIHAITVTSRQFLIEELDKIIAATK